MRGGILTRADEDHRCFKSCQYHHFDISFLHGENKVRVGNISAQRVVLDVV